MNAKSFLWPSAQPIPPLALREVHVYGWDLDLLPLESDWEILSEEESARARRFVFPRDRDRFVRAHAEMRRILGHHSSMEAKRIAFSLGQYGKPEVESAGDPDRIRFNLSHSAGVAVLAISRSNELGIDVEVARPIDADVAEHHFSPEELATLRALPPEQWQAGFYRCWTSKEALLKGEGCGLNLALDGFDVEADPRRAPALLGSRLDVGLAPGWRLVELKPLAGVLATLAVREESDGFSNDSVHRFSLSGRAHPG